MDWSFVSSSVRGRMWLIRNLTSVPTLRKLNTQRSQVCVNSTYPNMDIIETDKATVDVEQSTFSEVDGYHQRGDT